MKTKQKLNLMIGLALALGPVFVTSARAQTVPTTAPAPNTQIIENQIAASKGRIDKLKADLKVVDDRIENRVTKVVDELKTMGDSVSSGTKIARIKEDVINFMRKQIGDYSRRRTQLRAELDNRNRIIPEETIQADIDNIDARIDHRIAQVAALGGSFAVHHEYDKYAVSNVTDYGGGFSQTSYKVNEEWEQDRKASGKGKEERGQLKNAIDENIERLEFSNRSLNSRLANQTAEAAERTKADIARNEALIESLKGSRAALLAPPEQAIRAVSSKEAQSISTRLKAAGIEARRDQDKLIGFYNNINAERSKLATLNATLNNLKADAPQP